VGFSAQFVMLCFVAGALSVWHIHVPRNWINSSIS